MELERWWTIFESNIGIPFGRKLFNSCVDEEEFQLIENNFFNTGWFKKKKNLKNLKSRWKLLGWGEIETESSQILTELPSSMGPGLALAAIENLNNSRFKAEWKQINNIEIKLELKADENILSTAKKFSKLPWNIVSDSSIAEANYFELENRTLGWSVDGEPMVIIPSSIFSRLIGSTLGYETSISKEYLNSWNISGIDEKFSKPLILSAYSTFQLFIDSDKHVFIESNESWLPIVENYSSKWGWGNILSIEKIDESGGVLIKSRINETLPIFIGLMIGIWHRSYGRSPKIGIDFEQNLCFIRIKSLHEYN